MTSQRSFLCRKSNLGDRLMRVDGEVTDFAHGGESVLWISLSAPAFIGDKAAFTTQTGGQRGLRLPSWILFPSDNKNGIVGL